MITITGGFLLGQSLTIPSSLVVNGVSMPVTGIGFGAFQANATLTSVTIPDSVITIGAEAFWYCTGLTNVVLGNGVTNIGTFVFSECTNLTRITIPNSVTSIGDYAFNASSGLTNITLGTNVTSIGVFAFAGCHSLTNVVIPDSLTTIGKEAFASSGLTSVTIPSTVTSIGDLAFYYCTNLPSVTIPNSVTNIGSAPFFDCFKLTAIIVDTLNPDYSSVDGVLFNQSQTILIQYPAGKVGTSYTIPDSVTNIGELAFAACNLARITIPGSVTSISDEAFYVCANLTEACFEGNVPSANGNIFSGDNSATIFYLPWTTGVGLPGGWQYFAQFVGRPAMLWLPQIQTGNASFGVLSNQFGFNINWANGGVVVVETCTDLANPNWSPAATNTLTGSSSYFSDSQWTNFSARFYRLRW